MGHTSREFETSRRSFPLLGICLVLRLCLLSEGQPVAPTGAFQLPQQGDVSYSQGAQAQPMIGRADAVPDPHAPAAFNCFAAGDGIREGEVGKVATFEVVARDMFGDEHRCDPEKFVVRVLPLTASHDEDSVQCHAVQDSPGCLACRTTTVCMTGTSQGACQYAYTPNTPGFFRIQVQTPSTSGEGLLDIQGSPFRAHVEDGGYLLPGMSFLGYLGLFLVSILGALFLVTLFFATAWQRWKRRRPLSEDDLEIERLDRIAEGLEETRRGREERAAMLV